ncbi:Dabb family protein [Akkermansiaceae bacterium]|nr:Dabb family protein [Akkermansiaceae bacterium]
MIHHVIYLQLNDPSDHGALEQMVRAARTWLLKIPEVLSVKSGRNLDPESQWQFFYSYEVESMEKLGLVREDAFHLKFIQQFIKPHTNNQFGLVFELDPSRDLKYS